MKSLIHIVLFGAVLLFRIVVLLEMAPGGVN